MDTNQTDSALTFGNMKQKIKICLYVNDFGVKCTSKEDDDNLIQVLKENYEIIVDWKGKNVRGLNIYQNYKQYYVDISIHDYIVMALQKLQHTFPKRAQLAQHE